MGSIASKIPFVNDNRRKKYKSAYLLLGDTIFKNPIKYIINELKNHHKWEEIDILDMLIYLRDYTFVIENDMNRVREMEVWIDKLENKIMIRDNRDIVYQTYSNLYG